MSAWMAPRVLRVRPERQVLVVQRVQLAQLGLQAQRVWTVQQVQQALLVLAITA